MINDIERDIVLLEQEMYQLKELHKIQRIIEGESMKEILLRATNTCNTYIPRVERILTNKDNKRQHILEKLQHSAGAGVYRQVHSLWDEFLHSSAISWVIAGDIAAVIDEGLPSDEVKALRASLMTSVPLTQQQVKALECLSVDMHACVHQLVSNIIYIIYIYS